MAIKASATITLFDVVDVDSVTIYYLLQSSTSAAPAKPTTDNPGGNWSTTEPTYTEGSTNTLYTVTKTKYSDGSFEYTPVSKSSSYEAAKIAYNKAVAAKTSADGANDKIDNLEIGGRNLIYYTQSFEFRHNPQGYSSILSDEKFNNCNIRTLDTTNLSSGSYKEFGGFPNVQGNYNINLKAKEIYTFSFWAKMLSDTVTQAVCYFYGNTNYAKTRVLASSNNIRGTSYGDGFWKFTEGLTKEWKRVWVTWEIEDADATKIEVSKHILIRQWGGSNIAICGCKFERGNKPTAWTPAPEDAEEDISIISQKNQELFEQLQTASGNATYAKTEIDSLKGTIQNIVKDDNGMISMSQTGSGLQIDMTKITDDIKQLLNDIENNLTSEEAQSMKTELQTAIQAVQDRTAYINASVDGSGRPIITLGATNSPFKVQITNEAINFVQNGEVIAYANGQAFYNLRTVVQQDVQIGVGPGYIFKTRANGNMGLTYVPG